MTEPEPSDLRDEALEAPAPPLGRAGAQTGMNEGRMRELYARSTARRAVSGPSCEVSLEAMIDLLERRGSEEERRRVLGEILKSPACREEFELLRAVMRASQPVKTPVMALNAWCWAAGIMVILGLGLADLLWRGRSAEPLRGGSAPIVLHGPAESARMSSMTGFAWRAVPGALQYRLQVLTDSGRVAFDTTVRDTVVAPLAAAALPAGHYVWLVIAEMESGEPIRSAASGFTLEPR
jgi:hypothetical protein